MSGGICHSRGNVRIPGEYIEGVIVTTHPVRETPNRAPSLETFKRLLKLICSLSPVTE